MNFGIFFAERLGEIDPLIYSRISALGIPVSVAIFGVYSVLGERRRFFKPLQGTEINGPLRPVKWLCGLFIGVGAVFLIAGLVLLGDMFVHGWQTSSFLVTLICIVPVVVFCWHLYKRTSAERMEIEAHRVVYRQRDKVTEVFLDRVQSYQYAFFSVHIRMSDESTMELPTTFQKINRLRCALDVACKSRRESKPT